MAFSWAHQSSVTTTVSCSMPLWPSNLSLLACSIILAMRSGWTVLRTLKKYSRSMPLPLAVLSGMYCMTLGSAAKRGSRLVTDSSSNLGIWTNLTSAILRSCFSPARTWRRKSRLTDESLMT